VRPAGPPAKFNTLNLQALSAFAHFQNGPAVSTRAFADTQKVFEWLIHRESGAARLTAGKM
jgi:hypothetical protein